MPDIPQFGVKTVASYKYVYDAYFLPQIAGETVTGQTNILQDMG